MLFQSILITKQQGFIGSLLTLLAYVYGLVSTPLFWILMTFSIIDFILGVYSAWKNKELNWDRCLEGVANKVFIGILIVLSAMIDFALVSYGIQTQGLFHNFIMGALLTRELGSVIKNAEKGKLWVPQFMKDARDKLSGKKW